MNSETPANPATEDPSADDRSTVAGGLALGLAIPLLAFGSVAFTSRSSGDSLSESMFWGAMVVAILGVAQILYIAPLAVFAAYTRRRAQLKGLMIAAAVVAFVFVAFAVVVLGFGI